MLPVRSQRLAAVGEGGAFDITAMTHSDLDPVIIPWTTKHRLHLYTEARDEEARDIYVVDDSGDGYHISVIPLGGENSTVGVEVWSAAKAHTSYRTTLGGLAATLDHAYAMVLDLIARNGHTRTPVT